MRLACPYQLSPTQNLIGNGMQASARNAVANTYATWDPAAKGANVTLSNGNLTASIVNTTLVRSTIGKASGKWYWEITVEADQINQGVDNTSESVEALYVAATANGWSYYGAGPKINNATQTAYGATYTVGDVIGVALDMDGGTITFYKNNVSQGQAFSGLTGTLYAAIGSNTITTARGTVNFGATALTYTPPSGFNSGLYD